MSVGDVAQGVLEARNKISRPTPHVLSGPDTYVDEPALRAKEKVREAGALIVGVLATRLTAIVNNYGALNDNQLHGNETLNQVAGDSEGSEDARLAMGLYGNTLDVLDAEVPEMAELQVKIVAGLNAVIHNIDQLIETDSSFRAHVHEAVNANQSAVGALDQYYSAVSGSGGPSPATGLGDFV